MLVCAVVVGYECNTSICTTIHDDVFGTRYCRTVFGSTTYSVYKYTRYLYCTTVPTSSDPHFIPHPISAQIPCRGTQTMDVEVCCTSHYIAPWKHGSDGCCISSFREETEVYLHPLFWNRSNRTNSSLANRIVNLKTALHLSYITRSIPAMARTNISQHNCIKIKPPNFAF